MKEVKYIVGIDEVGRGPLAGPVTVCVLSCEKETYTKLKKSKLLPKLGKDSKKLTKLEREKYSKILKQLSDEKKIFFSINHISNKIIDSKGLTFSINRALTLGISKLKIKPKNSEIVLDGGLKAGREFINQKTIIKGDEKEKVIAWASILAKVNRDELMLKFSKQFPDYSFELHKGYGTEKHRLAIKKHGLSSLHRESFCNNF